MSVFLFLTELIFFNDECTGNQAMNNYEGDQDNTTLKNEQAIEIKNNISH